MARGTLTERRQVEHLGRKTHRRIYSYSGKSSRFKRLRSCERYAWIPLRNWTRPFTVQAASKGLFMSRYLAELQLGSISSGFSRHWCSWRPGDRGSD